MTDKTRNALYEFFESFNRVMGKLKNDQNRDEIESLEGSVDDVLEALNEEPVT